MNRVVPIGNAIRMIQAIVSWVAVDAVTNKRRFSNRSLKANLEVNCFFQRSRAVGVVFSIFNGSLIRNQSLSLS